MTDFEAAIANYDNSASLLTLALSKPATFDLISGGERIRVSDDGSITGPVEALSEKAQQTLRSVAHAIRRT